MPLITGNLNNFYRLNNYVQRHLVVIFSSFLRKETNNVNGYKTNGKMSFIL